MGGGHHVGAGRVHRGVQHIGGTVHAVLADDDLAVVVDQQQVGHPHVAERQPSGLTQK